MLNKGNRLISKELKVLTSYYPLVFPSRNDTRKQMSDAAINKVIKMLGLLSWQAYRSWFPAYNEHHFAWCTDITAHGLKPSLLHVDKNSIRGTYNHAQYLEGRRKMLQWYSNLINITEL
ncbi:hypothetical protein BJJ97_19340 [Pectobacterium polaris]|nr:hypothetical protein BJJ97_19340 [Pectobacterium polaris]